MDGIRRRIVIATLRRSTMAHDSDQPAGAERARSKEFKERRVAEMKRRQAERHAAKFSTAA